MAETVSRVAKLTAEKVKAIRLKYISGKTQAELAQHYKVTQATISNVVNRKFYKRVA